jgi:hypothetical protein
MEHFAKIVLFLSVLGVALVPAIIFAFWPDIPLKMFGTQLLIWGFYSFILYIIGISTIKQIWE